MEDPFGFVLIVMVLLAIVTSALSFWGSGSIYGHIGKTGLSLDEPDPHADPAPGTAAYDAMAIEEIRQMLEAKNARRQARGQAPLDIDAEIAILTAP